MRIAFYSAKSYDRSSFDRYVPEYGHIIDYFETRLSEPTAALARDYEAICVFVNDCLDRKVQQSLVQGGTRYIALRCAGFNQVDLRAAAELGLRVTRVPAYSPYAVAEHTLGMILSLNRGIHRAYHRVREGNFSLQGLLGFDLHGASAGIVGTGRIGSLVAQYLCALGCKVYAHDLQPDPECVQAGVVYTSLEDMFRQIDILSLHCPLTPATHHLINADAIAQMKKGVMIINTSRGAVIDTRAVIDGLKARQIGYLGLDVYEQEGDLFFEDLSNEIIADDMFERLLTFPNVLITGHQGYFTRQALDNIAQTTLSNLRCLEQGQPCAHELDSRCLA